MGNPISNPNQNDKLKITRQQWFTIILFLQYTEILLSSQLWEYRSEYNFQ